MHDSQTAMIPGEPINLSSIGRHRRWKATALASAAALALLGASVDAQAVAFGAATVRSTLGEPLRAEIEVPQISSEEAASLQVNVASPQAFRAAGLEYTQTLSGARITLQRRANGDAYLRLVSDHPVNEPFLSVVIEASWTSGGHIVRDYTMLIDPPAPATQPPVAVTPAEVAPPAQPAPQPQAAARPASESAPSPAIAPPPAQSARAPVPATGSGTQITVQPGNTAYSIANANLPEGVSLDQMLLAMLRANPQAFINGNVNLMRAGAVLKLPTAEQATALPPEIAKHTVRAQAHNFNSYRRSVAQNVRSAPVVSAGRRASGRVQTQIRESRAPTPTPDRLTLSRGGAPTGAETAAAQSRQAQEQASRVAELNRNINEINEVARLQSASGPVTAASAPGISVPVGAGVPAAAAASAAASVASAATATASAASAPARATSAPARRAPTPAPQPAPEPGFLDALMNNLPLIGGGALIALLAGYGFYRVRRRKKQTAPLDSSFTDNRLSPDSFFNASGGGGGQRVNTRENNGVGNTSLAYSPSQLDAAGDVDPVAEADVYLAYGRDAQAEEILKEALRAHPERIAIQRKLAEIYAKRRDARALQVIAAQAYAVTHGKGEDWQAITTLGSELDPDNQLYKPGGAPVAAAAAPAAEPTRRNNNNSNYFGADTEPQTALLDTRREVGVKRSQPESAPVSLDLDLGLPPAPSADLPAAPAAPVSSPAPVDQDSGMNFTPPLPEPSFTTHSPTPAPAPANPAKSANDNSDMLEFDMDALAINPDTRSGAELKAEPQPDIADDDPLGTKLALAQEFHAIGDDDGARTLVKEVIAEASGSIKARAQRFLAELS
jgi:pilus assembly protein FimV